MSASRRPTRAVAGALAVAALAVPGASARSGLEQGSGVAGPGEAIVSGEPVVVRTPDPGFDWSAAALGAGATAGLLLLGAAGGSVVRSGTGPSCPHSRASRHQGRRRA
jgi:hypothetical protein